MMTKNPQTLKEQKDAVIGSLKDVQLKSVFNIDAKKELDVSPDQLTLGTDFVADQIYMGKRNPTKKGFELQ
jgi:bifunctional ADP-heptose synthase (sugar kinase/adenylyltransferase)